MRLATTAIRVSPPPPARVSLVELVGEAVLADLGNWIYHD